LINLKYEFEGDEKDDDGNAFEIANFVDMPGLDDDHKFLEISQYLIKN